MRGDIKPKVKPWLRYMFSVLLFYSGFAVVMMRWKRKYSSQQALVLAYHRVVSNSDPTAVLSFKELNVSPEEFEKQVVNLKKYFNILSLDELLFHLESGESLHRPSCLITFDDGWMDNFQNAYPILKKHKVPATIFLSTGFIGTKRIYWTHKLWVLLEEGLIDLNKILSKYNGGLPGGSNMRNNQQILSGFFQFINNSSLHKRDKIIEEIESIFSNRFNELTEHCYYLSWEEVREMEKDNIAFGAHSHSHEPLTIFKASELEREMSGSKKLLEKKLSVPIISVSYPHSLVNPQVRKQTEKSGYRLAFTGDTVDEEDKNKQRAFYTITRVPVISRKAVNPWGHFSQSMFFCHINRLLP